MTNNDVTASSFALSVAEKMTIEQNSRIAHFPLKGRVKKKRLKRVTSYKKVGWVGPQNHISRKNEKVTLSKGRVGKFFDVIIDLSDSFMNK